MNRTLLRAGIVVLCLPMLFALWLLTATLWPKMDALTMKLPMAMRSMVASAVAQARRQDEARARRLDPNVQLAAYGEYETGSNVPENYRPGQKVNSPEASALDRQGQAKEAAGDECGSVTFFTLADSKEDSTDGVYRYAEHKGRAALLCGKSMGAAQVGFETALKRENHLRQFSVGDQSALDATMQQDREWLIVVYDRVNEPGMSHNLCKVTHPNWKSCGCKLVGKNVVCTDAG